MLRSRAAPSSSSVFFLREIFVLSSKDERIKIHQGAKATAGSGREKKGQGEVRAGGLSGAQWGGRERLPFFTLPLSFLPVLLSSLFCDPSKLKVHPIPTLSLPLPFRNSSNRRIGVRGGRDTEEGKEGEGEVVEGRRELDGWDDLVGWIAGMDSSVHGCRRGQEDIVNYGETMLKNPIPPIVHRLQQNLTPKTPPPPPSLSPWTFPPSLPTPPSAPYRHLWSSSRSHTLSPRHAVQTTGRNADRTVLASLPPRHTFSNRW